MFCHDKHTFVVTEDVFCSDKSFVATKLILVAAPTNDSQAPGHVAKAVGAGSRGWTE